MNIVLVMTMVGPDRPGLVESVADLLATQGGNWLESRMARLGGQFAGILRCEIPALKEAEFVRALAQLRAKGLETTICRDRLGAAEPAPRLMRLEVVGHDRPGIVRQISRALAAQRINVEELDTECSSAPMTGETLFKARAELMLPPDCDQEALRRELEKIAADLIVDIKLNEAAAT